MDKKYVQLFKELTRATAVASEQVMDYDKSKNDEEGFKAAQRLRDDYENLNQEIVEGGDEWVPDKSQATKLLLASMIQITQLKDKIEALHKAMVGYNTDLVPKLQEIVDAAADDEAAKKMANEKFILDDNE
jgi:hypothetical protein